MSDHDHEARRSRGVGTLVHAVFLDRCICSKTFRDVPKKDESSHVDSSRGTNKANCRNEAWNFGIAKEGRSVARSR